MIQSLIAWDHALLTFVHDTLKNRFFDWLMPLLSDARFWAVPLLIAAVVAVRVGKRRVILTVIMLGLAVGVGDSTGAFLKELIGRARPFDGPPTSFPSNHAINTFACATMIAAVWRNRWIRMTVYGIALAVAFSRVYLGAHYPADVVAGACWGSLVGGGLFVIARHRFPRYFNETHSH